MELWESTAAIFRQSAGYVFDSETFHRKTGFSYKLATISAYDFNIDAANCSFQDIEQYLENYGNSLEHIRLVPILLNKCLNQRQNQYYL